MNVLLVVVPYLMKLEVKEHMLRSFTAFPYGVLSIASYLKKNAPHANVRVLDCNLHNDLSALKETLKDFSPSIVGLSMMFDISYKHLSSITAMIKEHDRRTIVVLGGSAATSSYENILEMQPDIDAICYYEGERPMLKLIRNDYPGILNDPWWITRQSLLEKRRPEKLFVWNLDELIDIDYSLVNVSDYEMVEAFSPCSHRIKNKRQFILVTSRGCKFGCSFCFHSGDPDKTIRYASAEKIISHVKHLVDDYGMNVLTINDDQLLLNMDRAKQIFAGLAGLGIRIECPNGLSVAFMDEELIALMRAAGMDTATLAIESGCAYVLNNIIHKPLTLDKVKPVVDILRKYDFWIHGFFVSGIPGETDKHRDETVRFIKEVGLDWAVFNLAMVSRGSDLFRMCVQNGYIDKNTKIGDLQYSRYIINTPEYSTEHVTTKTYRMNLDVNFVNNYRMKHGEYAIAADAFRDVIRRYEDQAFAYYYLGKALWEMDRHGDAADAFEKYTEIVLKDPLWKAHAEYFGLET
jgi:radical SAM superfamily enzyme YgiQ (UPF0313 family)